MCSFDRSATHVRWRRSAAARTRSAARGRAAAERIQDELARTSGTIFSPGLLLLDADHFKAVNDNHGHVAGDLILALLSRRIQEALRPYDTLARWGGEEFVAFLPNVPSDVALAALAERVRSTVATEPFAVEAREIRVTVSIGAARARPGRWTLETLVRDADHALYDAKARGRDRSIVAGGPSLYDEHEARRDVQGAPSLSVGRCLPASGVAAA